MVSIGQRNAFLIVCGIMLSGVLVFVIVDIFLKMVKYQTCPKYLPEKEVQVCWACFGMESCEEPYRQYCSELTANDTRYKIREFWTESSDNDRILNNLEIKPRDKETENYIINNTKAFKCISTNRDYWDSEEEMQKQVQVKGCIYAEFMHRHMYTYDIGENKSDTGISEHQYICSDNLCNSHWSMNDLTRPRNRRFFEGPKPPSKANPERIYDLFE